MPKDCIIIRKYAVSVILIDMMTMPYYASVVEVFLEDEIINIRIYAIEIFTELKKSIFVG